MHGWSVLARLQQLYVHALVVTPLTMLVCSHVGAGASMCAIEKGKCIDTSMGLTPLEG